MEPRDRKLLKLIAISTTFIAVVLAAWLLVFIAVAIFHG
jgi:hypothetical protein